MMEVRLWLRIVSTTAMDSANEGMTVDESSGKMDGGVLSCFSQQARQPADFVSTTPPEECNKAIPEFGSKRAVISRRLCVEPRRQHGSSALSIQ